MGAWEMQKNKAAYKISFQNVSAIAVKMIVINDLKLSFSLLYAVILCCSADSNALKGWLYWKDEVTESRMTIV